MIVRNRRPAASMSVVVCLAMLAGRMALGQVPTADTIFPAGGQAGQTVEVVVSGKNLQGLRTLHCNAPGLRCEPLDANRFRLTIPPETPPGQYDLWAVGENGLSAPRTFSIGNRTEQLEVEPNDALSTAPTVPLNVVINGKCDKAGDVDHFRFEAKQGQRVIVECSAERIDSRLRAVLEISDATGKRLAVNRGYFGIDPLIDFHVPSDGAYIVRVQDLVSLGSAEHYYRLDIDTGPRVAFSVPNVVPRGKPARIALYGWNLTGTSGQTPTDRTAFDRIEVTIPETLAHESNSLPVRLQPAQTVVEGFAYQHPGGHAPLIIGVTDIPVSLDRADNHSPQSAQEIPIPAEISGQLVAGDECDWYSIQAQRGEVLYIEGFGQRIQSPVDLQVSVLSSFGQNDVTSSSAIGQQELTQFRDEVRSLSGPFPTSHLDPAGRWVCPADGRYLIAIRNLTGLLSADPRRIYRLSVRREEPSFQLVAVPLRAEPSGLNLQRGGRDVLELLAFRQRGFNGSIRISVKDPATGIECPEVSLGPGVDRVLVVVSADRNAAPSFGELMLNGVVDESISDSTSGTGIVSRAARSGTIVRSGMPIGWGRLTSRMPIAVAGEAPLRIVANAHEVLNHHLYGKLQVRHAPGGVVDVAVEVERRDNGHQGPVKLVGAGLPDMIRNETAVIPAGEQKGYLSFHLPPTLPEGRYSLVVRAETTVPTSNQKTETVTVYSNPVTVDVQSPAFLVEVDPFAVTRAKRGEVIQVTYSAKRLNGFIGKLHTELAVPGHITETPGLRGRGETFTGQTDKGTLQITINDDAPLGRQAFLRLFTVGVVEDEPIYHGSSFLPLEIVE